MLKSILVGLDGSPHSHVWSSAFAGPSDPQTAARRMKSPFFFGKPADPPASCVVLAVTTQYAMDLVDQLHG